MAAADHRRLSRALARACLALMLVVAGAGTAAESQLDLNGWRLLQFVHAIEADYGPPHRVLEQDGVSNRVFMIDEAAYMVAASKPGMPNHITALQLTGSTDKALPFLGLSLGDPMAVVFAALGEPTASTRIEDWKLTRHDFDGRNFNVESDDDGRLYSIRIHVDADLLEPPPAAGSEAWSELAAALAARDVPRILDQLRPDVEIFRDGRTLDIRRRMRDFLADPEPLFIAALLGPGGVVSAAARHEPDEAIRVIDGVGVGRVFRFPADSVLDEVVFFPYAGRLRVYEIAFRAPAGTERRLMRGRGPAPSAVATRRSVPPPLAALDVR